MNAMLKKEMRLSALIPAEFFESKMQEMMKKIGSL